MARRGPSIPGWTRIGENEFKRAVLAATKTEPDLCVRLRRAIKATAARKEVRREVRDQYLAWLTEVEAAISTMTQVQQLGEAVR